jgi:ferritin
MIDDKMRAALNKQIGEELFSSYLYLSMANHFEAVNLPGFAQWMRVQAKEEMGHATKIMDFVNLRSGRVVLTALAAPTTEWESPLAAFEATYEHEQHVTGCINELVRLAGEEKDYATRSFLKWFVDEQVEEEAQALKILEQLRMIGASVGSLFQIDHRLSKRE